MLALVGLGNPSLNHKKNRHNVGFMFIDYIVRQNELGSFQKKFDSLIIQTKISSKPVLFIKPQTFMNRSGIAIAKIMRFYKLNMNNVIIFHDDLDINLGIVKTKIGGGNGGHNGLKSIDENIGKNYRRIRIGIDHPGKKELVNKHVLGNFKNAEDIIIKSLIKNFTLQLENFIEYFNNSESIDLPSKIKLIEIK